MAGSKARILVQLDSDPHCSVFDAVVAIDAGVQHLLQHAGVRPADVRSLVHGAIFTRGPQDLPGTAVFVGGSNVALGESLLEEIKASFLGPLRVSVMLDANGANTTAAAAVLAVARHFPQGKGLTVVLGATGPVGQRVVRLLARQGFVVRALSREVQRAKAVCDTIRQFIPDAQLEPMASGDEPGLRDALHGVQAVVAAGAAGVSLLPAAVWQSMTDLKLAIDLNAVPPLGIEGVKATDRGQDRNGVVCYGALGVGNTKMKIHKAAIQRLFESNDQILDAEVIFALGSGLE